MNELKQKRGPDRATPTQRLNKTIHSEVQDGELIKGLLTSRIETKIQAGEPYYYGFFKLADQSQEIPVIFKAARPNLEKGSLVALQGTWAKSNGDRPSFTCFGYKLLKEPNPPTLVSLQKEISTLIRPSLDKKQEWSQRTDFLFRKQKDLEEIRKISALDSDYLKAYLLTRQVFYANYQAEHLEQANFDLTSYLQRIASELEITKRQMLAAGWKEGKYE